MKMINVQHTIGFPQIILQKKKRRKERREKRKRKEKEHVMSRGERLEGLAAAVFECHVGRQQGVDYLPSPTNESSACSGRGQARAQRGGVGEGRV